MYFSPKTSADGLVFHYDTGNTVRSYLGEPTVNLSYNNGQGGSEYLAAPITWINAGSWDYNGDAADVPKPEVVGVNTAGLRVMSGTNTTAGGSVHFGCGYTPVSPSTTYTVSVWYRQNRAGASQPYLRTNITNVGLANLAYNGDTNSANWPVNQWIRVSATGTTASNENGIYISNYIGTYVGDKIWYFAHQVEQKSHVTPLVAGTRSATQGLKDLTAANTVNLSNVSFDSNAQMTFDGTDDYVDVGDLGTVGSTYSLECVFKSTSVTSYKNVFDMNYATYSGVTGNTGPRLEQTSGQGINFIWSGVTNNNGLYNYTNTFAISADTYYHVVFVQNGTTGAMYVNGALKDQANNAQGYLQTFGDFNIGRGFILDPSRYFSGNVDMFKIFNRALTADEVARNFNAIKSRFNIG